jgi:hypothetical protein
MALPLLEEIEIVVPTLAYLPTIMIVGRYASVGTTISISSSNGRAIETFPISPLL